MPFFTFEELGTSDFVIRALVVGVVALIFFFVIQNGQKWIAKHVEASYCSSRLIFTIGWLFFYILLAYTWFKAISLCGCPARRQIIDLMFGGILVLTLCWFVQLYHGHDVEMSRWFLIGAVVVTAIAVMYLWRLHPTVAMILLVPGVWLAYQAVVMMTAKEKKDCDHSAESDD